MIYVITGTSSGLGYNIAERLIKKGQVIGVSRTIGKSLKLKSFGPFTHVVSDLSKLTRNKASNKLIEKLQSIIKNEPFVLVLNAAAFYYSGNRITDSKLNDLFNINVLSSMILVDGLEKLNLKRIFVVNSVSGLIGQSNQHEYCASKHALMGYVRSLIKSAKNSKYDVMCINPGGIQTELWSVYDNINSSDRYSSASIWKI